MPDGPPLACRTARRLFAALLLLRIVSDAVAHVANPPARSLLSRQLIRPAARRKYRSRLIHRFSRALRDSMTGRSGPFVDRRPMTVPAIRFFARSSAVRGRIAKNLVSSCSVGPRARFFSGVASACGASPRRYGSGRPISCMPDGPPLGCRSQRCSLLGAQLVHRFVRQLWSSSVANLSV